MARYPRPNRRTTKKKAAAPADRRRDTTQQQKRGQAGKRKPADSTADRSPAKTAKTAKKARAPRRTRRTPAVTPQKPRNRFLEWLRRFFITLLMLLALLAALPKHAAGAAAKTTGVAAQVVVATGRVTAGAVTTTATVTWSILKKFIELAAKIAPLVTLVATLLGWLKPFWPLATGDADASSPHPLPHESGKGHGETGASRPGSEEAPKPKG
jgi:hypothetical protein